MKKINEKETTKKKMSNFKLIGYLTIFYFALIGILSLVVYSNAEIRESFGLLNLILTPVLIILGLYLGYEITRKKKWAVISTLVLASYQLIVRVVNMYAFDSVKLPISEIGTIIILIYALKNWNKWINDEK